MAERRIGLDSGAGAGWDLRWFPPPLPMPLVYIAAMARTQTVSRDGIAAMFITLKVTAKGQIPLCKEVLNLKFQGKP